MLLELAEERARVQQVVDERDRLVREQERMNREKQRRCMPPPPRSSLDSPLDPPSIPPMNRSSLRTTNIGDQERSSRNTTP